MIRPAGSAVVSLGVAALLVMSVFAQSTFEFMSDGGRTLLLDHFGPGTDNEELLTQIVEQERPQADWRALIADKAPALDASAAETLAGYLAVNMPLADPAPVRSADRASVAAALPPDGKQLALDHCQFCHSFFTGYLVQDRDVDGWLSTFKAPFHREIKMSEKERQTFARYSAVNMPMKYEDVPEELRF
jgi:mono/diheme cytochrome c family protein